MRIQNLSTEYQTKGWDEVVDENGRHFRDDWELNDQTDFSAETLILNKGPGHSFYDVQKKREDWNKEFIECFEETEANMIYNLKQARKRRNEQQKNS